jgi:hypothetical protein
LYNARSFEYFLFLIYEFNYLHRNLTVRISVSFLFLFTCATQVNHHAEENGAPGSVSSATNPAAATNGSSHAAAPVQVAKEALRQHLQSKPTSGPVDSGLLPKGSPAPTAAPPSILKKDSAYTPGSNKENIMLDPRQKPGGGSGKPNGPEMPVQKPRKVDGFVGFANLPDQVR